MTEENIFDRTAGYCQQLRTKNDVNGNPRRVWVIYSLTGLVLSTHDEGYVGKPLEARELVELPSIEVLPTEYRRFVKRGQSK
jgi:hypothetical protein